MKPGQRNPRQRAWAALSMNALVVPGLGSIFFLRLRWGWLQVVLGVSGFLMTVWWLSLTVVDWVRGGALPTIVPRPGLLLGGGAIFAAGWLWSVSDGLAALRAAPAEAPPEDR